VFFLIKNGVVRLQTYL